MQNIELFLKAIEWPKWQPSHKLYAVLDCAHLEDDSVWPAISTAPRSLRRPLFEGTADEGLSTVEPVLVDVLHPSYPKLLPWILEKEKKKPMVLWFVSKHTLDELHAHLTQLLTVDLPDAEDALLRFYDPGVFAKIMQVMTPDQDARFFTHVDMWWTWSIRRSMRYWFAKSEDTKPARALVFTEAQMQKFSQMDIADFEYNVKAQLLTDKAKLKHVQNMSDADLGEQIKTHIDKALAHGLETEDAIKAYVLCVAGALGWAFAGDSTHANIVQTLNNKSLDEGHKVEQLQTYCKTI